MVDLKISQPDEDKIEKYKTQLTAYKFALENPKERSPIKISKMGLKEIDSLLAGPLPEESPDCKWCQYKHKNY